MPPQHLRAAFDAFITVVTAASAVGETVVLAGLIANSYTSVSLQPPLLLVRQADAMSCFRVFAASQQLVANVVRRIALSQLILDEQQRQLNLLVFVAALEVLVDYAQAEIAVLVV